MYVRVVNGQVLFPYSPTDLIRSMPNVSWPNTPLSAETLAEYDIKPVTLPEQPTCDPLTQYVQATTPTQTDGVWSAQWQIINLPEQQAAYNVRAKRDECLKKTDWTQLSDAPSNKTAWADYREALRGIPEQEGFPWYYTWPEKPQDV